jgi:acetyl esterase/lipase
MASASTPYPYPYSQAAELDPRINIPRPVIEPALAPIIDSFPLPEKLDIDILRSFASTTNADTILEANPQLTHAEYTVPGTYDNTVILSVFTPKAASKPLPAVYHVHGGGMISGNRFSDIPSLLALLQDIPCIFVSVEYRLAPETQAPGPAEDCYAGLTWISANATTLGIDAAEIVVLSVSGGSPLAAAACLMARDRKVPIVPVKAQMLLSPMLDDRCDTISDQQFEYGVPWNGITNRNAWNHALGEEIRGTHKVTSYQAPSRATDLSNLPQTYIDAAECEVFRDPAVVYAMNLWRCGSTCELHIWPGGVHLFDAVENTAMPVVSAAIAAKRAWLRRMLVT